MDGFKRSGLSATKAAPQPTRPSQPPAPSTVMPTVAAAEPMADHLIMALDTPADTALGIGAPKRRMSRGRWVAIGIVAVLLVGALGSYLWYQQQLQPVGEGVTPQKVVITKDTSFSYVVGKLKERGLIRSEFAASIYGYLSGKHSQLKEGTCILVATDSTPALVDKLTRGCQDFKSVTFFPGATIEKPLYKPVHAELSDTMYIKHILSTTGYSDAQINSALAKQYTGPLFADKPAGTSLEGYIYGQTYYIDPAATAESVLETTFRQMYQDISSNKLVEKFKAQGLNLYQGITLASIVQRELNCEGKPTSERTERCYQYQQEIAQVFLNRLKMGMTLGSDVTFIYAADQRGVTPTVDIDSPYNTRIHTGLPPGPIASPGIHALLAVGNPTPSDSIYFIAGDDGLIYFAKDQAGHEANIRNHCQQLCNEL